MSDVQTACVEPEPRMSIATPMSGTSSKIVAIDRGLDLPFDVLRHVYDRRILLAHDNLAVLTDLFNAIEHTEAWALGPASNLTELTALLDEKVEADGAVLSPSLGGHDTFAAAERLMKQKVKIAFVTNRRNLLLPPALDGVCVFSPSHPAVDVLLALFSPRH